MLTHAVGKPHSYGCPPDIVESSLLDTGFSQDLVELPSKVVYHLEPGVNESPFAFWPKYVLDIVIPCCGDKNIGIPLRLLSLVVYEHLDNFLCQWESSIISILDTVSIRTVACNDETQTNSTAATSTVLDSLFIVVSSLCRAIFHAQCRENASHCL